MPEVSVIVCTYNRDIYLGKTLECLKGQTSVLETFEVLIIDNNSTDSTAELCHNFINERSNSSFYYYLEKNQGHTYARNRGIQESKGDILAFIDDDAFVCKDYVEQLIQSFKVNKETVAIGGKIVPVYESGHKPKWMSKFLLPLVAALDMGEKTKKFKKSKFPIGANMAFRKEVFDKYGLFDIRLGRRGSDGLEGGDEKDVFSRLSKNNRLILYNPLLKVDHIIPEKRVQIPYIKGLAIGVGTSERKRLEGLGTIELLKKWWSEGLKLAGTMILFFLYVIQFRFAAALMLVRFRFWVLKGLAK